MKSKLVGLLLSTAGSLSVCQAAPVIAESTVGVHVLQKVYLPAGIGDDLPKVLVFGTDGDCLGALNHGAAASLNAEIERLIAEPTDNCDLHVSPEFGVTEPSVATGSGKVLVQLLTFAGDFCQACSKMEASLKELAQSTGEGRDWRITRVSLEKAFNPNAKPKGECPACENKAQP